MKTFIVLIMLAAPCAQAQIYRCETPQGPVFADMPCGEQAEIITVEDRSGGIQGGPPDEVREHLQQQRAERSEAREARLAARAAAPQPLPPTVINVQQPVWYPGYWPSRPGQRPPHNRPWPERPSPYRPESGSLLRPPPSVMPNPPVMQPRR